MTAQNFYDTQGRLFRTETTRNSQTITENYGFDTLGRFCGSTSTRNLAKSFLSLKFFVFLFFLMFL